jgi:hypothetical protein
VAQVGSPETKLVAGARLDDRRRIVKRLTLLVAIMIGVMAVPAAALSYDKDEGVYGPPGSQLLLGTEAVPTEKVGLTCDVVVDIGNNESVRPGSDITITTGSDSHLFANTEGQPGDPGPVTIQMVMGETVSLTLTFGPNKEFDGHGFDNAAFSGSGTASVGACVTPPPTPPVVVAPDVVVSPATAVRATPVVVQPGFTG